MTKKRSWIMWAVVSLNTKKPYKLLKYYKQNDYPKSDVIKVRVTEL